MKKRLWLYSIPVLIGGYLIYKQFSKAGTSGLKDVPPPPQPKPTASSPSSSKSDFPLQRGSRNETVRELQSLLNTELGSQGKTLLVLDGIFGAKTEAALQSIAGVTVVKNAAELQSIKQSLMDVNEKTANLDWAWKLVDAYNTQGYDFLVVRQPLTLYGIAKNFQGVWKRNGKNVNLPTKRYNLNDYAIRSAMNDGSLRIEITRGEFAGMYATDPQIVLSQTLDIE